MKKLITFILVCIALIIPATASANTAQNEAKAVFYLQGGAHKLCPKLQHAVKMIGYLESSRAYGEGYSEDGYVSQRRGEQVFYFLVRDCIYRGYHFKL